MPPTEFATLATVQAAVLDLMSGTEPQFWAIGIRLFQAFATIRLVWLGVSIMLGHRHHGHAFIGEFVELMLLLSFGYAMVTFYAAPIPGLGMSFSEIIPSMAQYCANILDARALEQTFYHIDILAARFVAPGAWGVLENLLYWLILIVLALTKALAMLIVLGPLIGVALLVLLGGLFVPFFIVPHLDWLFWGWLKTLMSTAFAQVVAMAYLMIFSRFLDRLVLAVPDSITAAQFSLYGVMVIALVVVFAIGTFMIPSICGSLFGAHPPSVKLPGL